MAESRQSSLFSQIHRQPLGRQGGWRHLVPVAIAALACSQNEQVAGHPNEPSLPETIRGARVCATYEGTGVCKRYTQPVTPERTSYTSFGWSWIDELGNEGLVRPMPQHRTFGSALYFFGGTVVARLASSSRTALRSPGYQYSR